jgi:hypothetical protein
MGEVDPCHKHERVCSGSRGEQLTCVSEHLRNIIHLAAVRPAAIPRSFISAATCARHAMAEPVLETTVGPG